MTTTLIDRYDLTALRAMLLAHKNCVPVKGLKTSQMARLALGGYVVLLNGEWWLTEIGQHVCRQGIANRLSSRS
jgi:hypothetical protein